MAEWRVGTQINRLAATIPTPPIPPCTRTEMSCSAAGKADGATSAPRTNIAQKHDSNLIKLYAKDAATHAVRARPPAAVRISYVRPAMAENFTQYTRRTPFASLCPRANIRNFARTRVSGCPQNQIAMSRGTNVPARTHARPSSTTNNMTTTATRESHSPSPPHRTRNVATSPRCHGMRESRPRNTFISE